MSGWVSRTVDDAEKREAKTAGEGEEVAKAAQFTEADLLCERVVAAE